MSAQDYLIFILPFVGTVLIVFGLKYGSAAYQARARIAGDTAYRELAQSVVSTQSETAAAMAAMRAELAQITAPLAAIATILKEVE